MNKRILVAPSILSADFTRLEDEIKKVEDSGADLIHVDVMDGHFVPNITIGPIIVKAVKKSTNLPLDVHLMIESPHKFIKEFVDSGSDIITIHVEAYPLDETLNPKPENLKGMSKTADKINEGRIRDVLGQIRGFGKKAGISINPDTPISCMQGLLKDVDMILLMSVHPGFGGQKFIEYALPKLRELRKVYPGDIEVDGGINDRNVGALIEAGANIIVAGSYFFSSSDPKEAVRRLRSE